MTQALPEFLKTVAVPEEDLEFGKEITVTHTEVVPVSADEYWTGFDDYFRLQAYVGMHEHMTTIKGDGGVGTVIEFDFLGGRTQEILLEKDDNTKTWVIAMVGSNPLFKTYKAAVKVDEDTSDSAKVTMSITGIVALEDYHKRRGHIAFTKYMLRNRINEVLCLIGDKNGSVVYWDVTADVKRLWAAVNNFAGCDWIRGATGVKVLPDPQNYDLRRKILFPGDNYLEVRLVMGTENPNTFTYEFGRNDNLRVLHYRGKVEVGRATEGEANSRYTVTFLPQPGADAKAIIKGLIGPRMDWIEATFVDQPNYFCTLL